MSVGGNKTNGRARFHREEKELFGIATCSYDDIAFFLDLERTRVLGNCCIFSLSLLGGFSVVERRDDIFFIYSLIFLSEGRKV